MKGILTDRETLDNDLLTIYSRRRLPRQNRQEPPARIDVMTELLDRVKRNGAAFAARNSRPKSEGAWF
jgi:hypothetical protein